MFFQRITTIIGLLPHFLRTLFNSVLALWEHAAPYLSQVFVCLVALVALLKDWKDYGRLSRHGKYVPLGLAFCTLVIMLLGIHETHQGLVSAARDREQITSLSTQLQQYSDEQRRLLTRNSDLEEKLLQQSDTIVDFAKRNMNLSKNALTLSGSALKQITGGGQFCYISSGGIPAGISNGRTLFQLFVFNSGPIPLDACHVYVSTYSPPNLPTIVGDWPLGPVAPGKGGFITPIILPEGEYHIRINTRNDLFYEVLNIHPNDKKSREDVEVFRAKDGKLVFSEPPKSR
jgi:cell division protein FtsB